MPRGESLCSICFCIVGRLSLRQCAVLVRACVRAVALQVIHPNFRLFAAMNPPTDVGKKELPTALRNRFTEVLVLPPHDCCCIGRPGPPPFRPMTPLRCLLCA